MFQAIFMDLCLLFGKPNQSTHNIYNLTLPQEMP